MNTDSIRILKTGTCPSLSGKSKLTYELGCDDRAGLQLRIAKNTGKACSAQRGCRGSASGRCSTGTATSP